MIKRNKNSFAIRLIAFAGITTGAALGSPGEAAAYCRTSSCPGGVTGADCEPPQPSDCGIPLAWPERCISFSMQQDGSAELPFEVASQIVANAFAAWTSVDCAGQGPPSISVFQADPVECDQHQYNSEQGNANAVIFRDDLWPYAGNNTLALTTVTYNLETGEIRDADMELNSAQVDFTTTDTMVVFDLASVVTHEAGHFLGLAHSPVETATMQPDYAPGNIALRDLDADDIAGICAIYPPGSTGPAGGAGPTDCDPTPRNGFRSECGDPPAPQEESGCCTIAPGATARGSDGPGAGTARASVILSFMGLLVLGARRRRRPAR